MFSFLSSLFGGFGSSSDACSTPIDAGPSVNTNGMPMIPGSCIDVTGEVYGSTTVGGLSATGMTDAWSTSSSSDAWSSSSASDTWSSSSGCDTWSSSSSCGGSFGNDW